MSTTYPSDLTDAEWKCLQPYLVQMLQADDERNHSTRPDSNALQPAL